MNLSSFHQNKNIVKICYIFVEFSYVFLLQSPYIFAILNQEQIKFYLPLQPLLFFNSFMAHEEGIYRPQPMSRNQFFSGRKRLTFQLENERKLIYPNMTSVYWIIWNWRRRKINISQKVRRTSSVGFKHLFWLCI